MFQSYTFIHIDPLFLLSTGYKSIIFQVYNSASVYDYVPHQVTWGIQWLFYVSSGTKLPKCVTGQL